MGGGAGTRLFPLTKYRSKPAVPIAGKFRLIDIPISNCLNSGINRIFVLTQFNSASLNQHIKNTYRFDKFSKGFVDILAAEQTLQSEAWFQGTADAVRKSVNHLANHHFEYLLILSGDQLYQMDYKVMLQYHIDMKADVTVATIPVVADDAPGFGIMKVDENGVIRNFVEKPASEDLGKWQSVVEEKFVSEGKHYLASMGIYIFTRGTLRKLLKEQPNAVDFGKEIIPYAVSNSDYLTASYPFGGYWTDIGNISSFFEANLRLTTFLPEFNLYDNTNVLYTHARMLSPAKFFGTMLSHVLISGGSIVHAKSISRSIVGVRSRIGKNTVLEDTIIMGIDFYQSLKELEYDPSKELLGIGEDCLISRAIIDKNVKIGDNCTIIGHPSLKDADTPDYYIRQGIIIIVKGAKIPPNTTIGIKEGQAL